MDKKEYKEVLKAAKQIKKLMRVFQYQSMTDFNLDRFEDELELLIDECKEESNSD